MSTPASLIDQIASEWSITISSQATEDEVCSALADKINQLILHDFQQLVQLLYRIDVDEFRIRELLRKYPDQDAGMLIAHLILERQKQKIQSRKTISPDSAANDKEEKWE